MKFGIVNPGTRTVQVVDASDLRDAKIIAGLVPDASDHGKIFPGLGYVCGEFAMFEHPMMYFAVGRVLYPGIVVLYAYNVQGTTVDFDIAPFRFPVIWIGDEAAAEAAIKAGKIDRPQASIDGDVYWRWPEPRPDLEAVWRRTAGHRGDVIIDDVLIAQQPDGKK